MNLLSCAQVNLNSQVIRGLLIQTKEGTRDLLQKFNPSHKPTVLSDPIFSPWNSSQWELLSKQNPQHLNPRRHVFRILIVV
ncbi:hypothetical protein H4Q26_010218 [Puccinia striiformis f. sp. tritici PST-130]|nr:hypothetical protein H4Q26_010218 [Puccinia striiformis f. sp. tritici PST-130]